MTANPPQTPLDSPNQLDRASQKGDRKSVVAAGVLFGLGFSGFFDGVVLHQILQWHHMLTSAGYADTTVAGLKLNTLADGLFHVVTYAFTLSGLVVLWRALERGNLAWSSKVFGGALLIGAGTFDVVEGIIDHHILGIHHVKSGPNELAWDLGFLALGATLAILGWLLLRAGQQQPTYK
ncbi:MULTISPECIES: DUF2243 domain-containing protein [Trichocoleus]|uniref:DUF2243 domain-containing protein n=1 Tax=Trichocoleus desertorum GB2-A4 TaxID=2933944 RepID=A0ABV0J5A2_9CYAN|nr:DUF2243 domain-containing protein [Trichocoleus sp. FACHB-46]MBD1863751.1 DUF2243 domain-containing protein [Trichocoleus sp. FACHB-46]